MIGGGISILVQSRRNGNPNHEINKLFESFANNTKYLDRLEFCIKFDDDDPVDDIIESFKKYPLTIKHMIRPRGRGYLDIHTSFNQLFPIVNPKHNIFSGWADDFEVCVKDWDEIVYAKEAEGPEPLIFHSWLPGLHLSYEQISSELSHVDESPFWTRKLIELWGGFGHLSFTDGWTVATEWILHHNYGINITKYLGQHIVIRKMSEIDTPSNPRWHTARAENMALFDNFNFRSMNEGACLNIKNYLENNDSFRNKN